MPTWQRKTAGTLVAVVGIAFIGSVIVNQLFSVGPAFESMSDGFRPAMQPAAIAALTNDLAGLRAVSDEFGSKAVPTFSAAMQMTPEQFTSFMQQTYPDVAAGIAALPGIATNFRGVVGTLANERDRFARADAIPTSSLPATTIPWGLLVAGIVLLGLGVWIFVRPVRGVAIAAAIVGALLVAVPLVLSLPGKASAADTMNEHLKPVYTAQMLTGAKGALGTVGAMGSQMQEMLPALGQQLGMDETQLNAFLGESLPAMAQGMQAMPAAMGRFTSMVQTFRAHLTDYDTIKDVAFVPIVWTMIVGGILALLAGLWGALATRRPARVSVEDPAKTPVHAS